MIVVCSCFVLRGRCAVLMHTVYHCASSSAALLAVMVAKLRSELHLRSVYLLCNYELLILINWGDRGCARHSSRDESIKLVVCSHLPRFYSTALLHDKTLLKSPGFQMEMYSELRTGVESGPLCTSHRRAVLFPMFHD